MFSRWSLCEDTFSHVIHNHMPRESGGMFELFFGVIIIL